MRGTFSTSTNEVLRVPSQISAVQVEGILADISEALWVRAEKGRRAPTSEITFDNVPPEFAHVFQTWAVDDEGKDLLWRPVLRNVAANHQPEFWSFRPEAAHGICCFEDMTSEEDLPPNDKTVYAQDRTFTTAAGNLRLTKRGDITAILPPLHVRFRTVFVGPQKKRKKHCMVLSFTVGVVSADREARLRFANNYPKYVDHKAWVQLPWFDSPQEHYSRHLQQVCVDYSRLDRRALAVQAALSWAFGGPELACGSCINRPQDLRSVQGKMWLEEASKYVVARTKRKKDWVARQNFTYREHRFKQSRRALSELQSASDSDNAQESYDEPGKGCEIEICDLQWFLSQPDCPQWVFDERDALIASGKWPSPAQSGA